jgi:hypothetical protein
MEIIDPSGSFSTSLHRENSMNRLCGKPAFHGLIALALLMLSGCAIARPKAARTTDLFPSSASRRASVPVSYGIVGH